MGGARGESRDNSSSRREEQLASDSECLPNESSTPLLDAAGHDSPPLQQRLEMHLPMSVRGRRRRKVLTEIGTVRSGSTLPSSAQRRRRWCTGCCTPPTTPPSP